MWPSVELEHGLIRVEASWDRVAGLVCPKSRSGERSVPIPAVLRAHLVRHRLRQAGGGEGFVFPGRRGRPIDAEAATRRARRVWEKAALTPLTLHECRHTYAALMIAAGVNAKACPSSGRVRVYQRTATGSSGGRSTRGGPNASGYIRHGGAA